MDAAARARLSMGQSAGPIHSLVARCLGEEAPGAGTVVDVGCGTGGLRESIRGVIGEYIGCDVVRYDGYPAGVAFVQADLNRSPYPVPDASADAVTCVETIEHLENPRLLVRELARIVRPGGLVLITTPNQLSLFSKLSLLFKNQFQAFRGREYPAHITALVEEDLARIARECGLTDIAIRYTDEGRVPFSGKRWPAQLGMRGRAFSDNVAIVARRPR